MARAHAAIPSDLAVGFTAPLSGLANYISREIDGLPEITKRGSVSVKVPLSLGSSTSMPDVFTTEAPAMFYYAQFRPGSGTTSGDPLPSQNKGFPGKSGPPIKLPTPPIQISLPYKVLARIHRDGEVRVIENKNGGVTITIPLKINGNVGFSGDIAKVSKIDKFPISGKITFTVNLNCDIDETYQIIPKTDISYNWTDRPNVKVLGEEITFQTEASEALDKQVKKIPVLVSDYAAKLRLRQKLEAIWKVYEFPLPSSPVDGRVVFTPAATSFSGITAKDEAINAGIGIRGNVALFIGKYFAPQIAPLPPLRRTIGVAPALNLTVPLLVSYRDFERGINTVLNGHVVEAESPLGKVKVTFGHLKIFPTGDRIAMQLTFKADLNGKVLDVSGDAFLTCLPYADEPANIIGLKDVKITAALDNKIWSSVAFLFSGLINAAVEKKAVYDYKADIERGRAKLRETITEKSEQKGYELALNEESAGVSSIVCDRDFLIVHPKISAKLLITLRPDKI